MEVLINTISGGQRTRSGNEILLNKEFLECDLKILTGFIEPHFFAGFSGGGKAIMPGLASLETIQRNHGPANIDHAQARWGVTEGNPLWEEVREAALLAGTSFLVNVTLNREKEITRVFAGELSKAHRAGCAFVKKHAMVPVDKEFDAVISTNSGYPLDLNLYQSVKGLSAAAQVVREGGSIVMVADCWDGIPIHGGFDKMLRDAKSPQELLERIRRPGFSMQDMWQAQILAQILQKAQVHFYSDHLSDEQIEGAFMKPCRNITKSIKALRVRPLIP